MVTQLHTTDYAELITKYASNLGFKVLVQKSEACACVYLKLTRGNHCIKIAITNGTLPEKMVSFYDYFDYTVNTATSNNDTWFDCIAWLAIRCGENIPDSITDLLVKRKNRAVQEMTSEIEQVCDRQFERILGQAVDNCKTRNMRLFKQYEKLKKQLVGYPTGKSLDEKTRKLKTLEGQIIQDFG